MERLPCLATFSPAPATTKAAVVDMLKLPELSPPVPQVSTTLSDTWTRRDFSRMTRAIPAISWTVSPFMRRAVTSAPNCAGVASSAHYLVHGVRGVIGAQGASFDDGLYRVLYHLCPPARLRRRFQEILQQVFADLRHYGFGVELYALYGMLFVPDSHD